MKRVLPFLPLVCLSPLGYFLASYYDGAGILPRGSGFLISAACMFLLPWIVSAAFAALAKTTWAVRTALFICTLVAQPVLLFAFTPPSATSEMMGIAHRLRREFPPDEMRACAAGLREKERDGTLAAKPAGKDRSFLMSENAVLVEDSELPVSLRGRFQRVFIQPDHDSGERQVYFALDERTGIVCDSRKDVREFFVCSMGDGVQAYRYERL